MRSVPLKPHSMYYYYWLINWLIDPLFFWLINWLTNWWINWSSLSTQSPNRTRLNCFKQRENLTRWGREVKVVTWSILPFLLNNCDLLITPVAELHWLSVFVITVVFAHSAIVSESPPYLLYPTMMISIILPADYAVCITWWLEWAIVTPETIQTYFHIYLLLGLLTDFYYRTIFYSSIYTIRIG